MAIVSIVVPAYNASRYLRKTIVSVLLQTFTDWILIIVDDGSSDDTCAQIQELCAQDGRIRMLSQANAGAGAARNNGWQHADPDSRYVVFLDSDDLWHPRCLELLYSAAEGNPDCLGSVCRINLIDENGEPILDGGRFGHVEVLREKLVDNRLTVLNPEEPTTFESLVTTCNIWTPGAVLLRLDAVRRLGGFDVHTIPAEDWHFWIELTRTGTLTFVNEVLMFYRQHEGMTTMNEVKHATACRRVRMLAATSPKNTPQITALICSSHRAVELRLIKIRMSLIREALIKGKMNTARLEGRRIVGNLLRCITGPRYITLFDFFSLTRSAGDCRGDVPNATRPGDNVGGVTPH